MKHSRLSESPAELLFTGGKDEGLLIAFEGMDGSGKTTQRKLFKSWLRSMRKDVVVTKWNSSPRFKPLIKAKKTDRSLDAVNYATLHAGDFWDRQETVVQPALASGKIVLADRYVFTGLARDVARGLNRDWCTHLYAGARKPDIVFYFRASVDTCAMRIAESREMKFYEAGQDVTGLDDAFESYLQFAGVVVSEYERLHDQFGFVIVDAEQPIYDQHQFIRETYLQHGVPPLVPQLHAFLSEVDV